MLKTILSILCVAAAVLAPRAGEPVQLKPFPQVEFREDTLLFLPLKEYFADPAGQPLAYRAETLEDSLFATPTDSTLLLAPFENWNGAFTVELLVTSRSGQTISRTLHGRVWSVNDPPYANSVPAFQIPEDSAVDLNPADYFFDRDGRIVSVISDPGKVSMELVDARLRIKAAKDWYGTEQVGIRVTDDSGAAARFEFRVVVAPVNDAPTLSRMPADASMQANGTLVVDFAGLVADVDDPVAGLVARASPQAGMRFRSEGTRLTIMPFARIDTVLVAGVVADSSGGTASFAFNVSCNEGFKENSLSLYPNLPRAVWRSEPIVLMNADGSWDAVTMADTAVFLNRYRPDGTQKAPGRALRLNVRDTVSHISIKRDTGVYFLATMAYNSAGGTQEIWALDTAFRETARLESPPPGSSTGKIELDVARKRVLLARTEMAGTYMQTGTLTLYDYGLNRGASKRFHVAVPLPDSAPNRVGQTFIPYITDVSIAVLPGKYALLWGSPIRTSRYYNGVRYASLSPDLVQSDSDRVLDPYVDDRPDTPLNDIPYFFAYTQWGHVYGLWHLHETSWNSIGSYTAGPTIRIQRLDADLKPASPIRKVSSGKAWYLVSEPPQFLEDEVLVPWNTSDSYALTPREFYAVHFRPELDTGRSELLARDTNNSSPKRHLLNGKPYLLSRRLDNGMVMASLADGRIPIRIHADGSEAGGKLPEKNLSGIEPASRPGAARRFDASGRTLTGKKHPVRAYAPRKPDP